MFNLLKQFGDNVIAAFQSFWNWITGGIYDLIVWAYSGLVEHLTIWAIKFQIMSAVFAWDVGKQVLIDLGVSARLQTAWNVLPSGVAGLLAVLNVPQAIAIILTALAARIAMRFIPGLK
jgi:hypothetical protein